MSPFRAILAQKAAAIPQDGDYAVGGAEAEGMRWQR
jgi:hypothetical protein